MRHPERGHILSLGSFLCMFTCTQTREGGSPKNIGGAAGRERARSCAKYGAASSAGVLAARMSYSHAHLFCVLSQGFLSKRETARHRFLVSPN